MIPGEKGGVGNGPQRMKQPHIFGDLSVAWYFRSIESRTRVEGVKRKERPGCGELVHQTGCRDFTLYLMEDH